VADDLRVIVDADADPLVRELKRAGVGVRGFGSAVTSQSRGARAFSAALDKQRESLRGLATFSKHAAFAIGGGLTLAIGHAIKTGAEFESQMARVKAVTSASGAEMDELRKLALKLGADTKFSAGEAAEAMYELASAGFDVRETAKALPGTLSLAAASGIDLASAAEISSNALRGFGLASAKSTHVSDVLAKSVNTSSVEMEDLQLSLKYIGPVARVTGQSFESMIAAVSLMGDAGIKGEQAGTSLRGGLLRLVKPTKQVMEGLKVLGVSVEDLQGPNGLLPLPQLVGKLQDGMQGLSKAEQAHALASVFGNEALSGMLTVVEAGPAKLARLAKEFDHSNGASAKAAKTMNDTVKGSFDQLKGSIETFEIGLFEHFSEPLKRSLLDATRFVNVEGERLQAALDAAMATPEFKSGDFSEKLDILADALGEEWRSSGLQEKITEGLVNAFNFALPRIAEAAGRSAVTVAETFASGFLKSDVLGKLVIGAWLFTKLGGFAALRAAGTKAGAQVSIGMQEAITAQQVGAGVGTTASRRTGSRTIPTRRAFPPPSRPIIPTPIVTPEVDLPDGIRKGLEWGKSFLKGFGASMLIGGGIAGALAPADGLEAKMQNIASGMTFGIVPEAGPSLGSQLAISAAEGFDEHFGPNVSAALRRHGTGRLEGFAQEIRRLIELAIQDGAEEAELKPLRERLQAVSGAVDLRLQVDDNLDSLRSGLIVRMQDIRKLFTENSRNIGLSWKAGSDGWRKATVQNMQGVVSAIKSGMAQGTIRTKVGQQEIAALLREIKLTRGDDPIGIAHGFADSWKKAGAVNRQAITEVKRDLAKMPKDSREAAQDAMLAMARAMESKGQLVKGSADRLRSALITKFGQTNKQLVGGMGGAVKGIAGLFDHLAGAVGEALQGLGLNVNAALKAFGVTKAVKFVVHTTSAAADAIGSAAGGLFDMITKAEGGFVPGNQKRDHVHALLGSKEAVLNVHQQPEVQQGLAVAKAMGIGRHGSLNELFSGVSRPNHLARGGMAGGSQAAKVPHPILSGPTLLAGLGQEGIDLGWKAAIAYLKEHAKAVSGGNIVEVGRSLQRMGYEVGEHPAFGGVGGVHVAGSDHYSGHAIDVNDDAPPYGHGSGEMASLDWLAPQLMKLPHRQIIWRNRDWDNGAPIGGHMDHLHLAMALGGFVQNLIRGMATGGWVKTGYTTYDVDGSGAGGNLMSGAGYAELGTATEGGSETGTGYIAQALGMSGELPFDFPLEVKIGSIGKIGTLFKRDRGYGQGDPYYSIDIHRLGWDEVGLTDNSKGDAWIRPADGENADSGTSDGESKRAEAKKVKAQREAHLKKLRKTVADAKTRPGKRGALWQLAEFWGEVGLFDKDTRQHMLESVRNAASQANPFGAIPILSNLADYLNSHVEVSGRELGDKSLADEIDRVREQGTKVGDRRRKKVLGKIAGRGLDKKRREMLLGLDGDIGRLDETIDIHGRLASAETGPAGSEYTDAETGDLIGLNQGLLGTLFRRRDLIQTISVDLAKRVLEVTEEIKAARPPESKTHWKLPGLLKNREEARSLIGEMHEALIDTQGTTGGGGRLFDTQMAIEELGAPKQSAVEENPAWTAAKEALLLQAQQNLALSQGETRVFGGFFRDLGVGVPFLGAYMQGTAGMRIGQTGLAMLHRDEQVVPDPKGPAGSQFAGAPVGGDGTPEITLVFADNSGQLVRLVDARVDGKIAKVNTQLGADARRRATAPGLT
jgi:TP901 family phage tail tape measure protein